jgi:hypothetical protein
MIKFSQYMKKHKVLNDEELEYVKFKEDQLHGEWEDNHARVPMNRFKLISDIGKHLFNLDENSIIYSNHKSFDTLPISNPDMNKRGLHIFRMVFSRLRYDPQSFTNYDWSGLVKYDNYVNDPYADLISEECKEYPLVTMKTDKNLLVDATTPGLKHLLVDSPLKQTILSSIKCLDHPDAMMKFRRNTFIQRVNNKPNDNDEQKVVHSDIFFPAIKFWYFPNEVKDGTFCFVKHSSDLTEELCDFYYDQSCKISNDSWDRKRDRSHPEGSMRIFSDEIEKLGLKLEEVKVEKNTLVVANVGGFHSRGECKQEHIRDSVHGSIRIDQPFK